MDVSINYLAVLLAAVLSLGAGFLWYGPLFGAYWQNLMGITPEQMKSMTMTPLVASLGGFVMSLLTAFVLAYLLAYSSVYTGVSGLFAGLMAGFWAWFGFALPLTSGVFLWEGKSASLWILNAGYYLASFLLMGAVLSLWA